MNIGIDFDNTIVTYDKVFHKHAARLGYISADFPVNKREIRDTIRQFPDGETKWIKLQGLVYGMHIAEADLSAGLEPFLKTCLENSVRIFIISHKTNYPALGPRYNLRNAAMSLIEKKGLAVNFGISPDDCFFVDSLAGKLAKVSECDCNYFIDDLVEVLSNPDFPEGIRKILYSSRLDYDVPAGIITFNSWDGIHEYIFGE